MLRLRHVLALCFAALLTLVLATASTVSRAAVPPVADFVPPLSPAQAESLVAEAQAAQRQVLLPVRQQQAVDPGMLPFAPTFYFPQTGHHLSNRSGFLNFWRANGQVLLFGYPITEEFVERGRIVQYFERARFEFHPGGAGQPAGVRLGLLGRELTEGRSDESFASLSAEQAVGQFFPETGQALSGEFLRFWERRGGLEAFGFPISQELDEEGRTVQYFERARFVYNPDDMPAFYRSMEQANGIPLYALYEVQLSDIGRQVAALRGIDTSPVPAITGAVDWSPARWKRHIEVDLTAQWLTAYEGDLPVYRAPVATGRDGFNTPVGNYAIYQKYQMQTMTGSMGGETWNVPNVPWVMYVVGGVAIHGTYWHNNFGTGIRMSHGCINVGMDDARWLWEWADIGTTVTVRQ
ncbi:MAG: L,D-transpeptidase [Chloroflexaceae bacterium]|jgi:lipoprotein-anchoring transpeptidase ErfK/SrfK|nr:L,D-transpeptidase [Chloroflexaceae bacterium]